MSVAIFVEALAMFTAYPTFKHPVQFGNEAPAYLAVELTLNSPWLIAESIEGDYTRTFMLDGLTELDEVFLQNAPFGPLDRLSLILPPTWSSTREWCVARIQQIQQLQDNRAPTALLLLGDDGQRYTGFPIELCGTDVPAGNEILKLQTGARE